MAAVRPRAGPWAAASLPGCRPRWSGRAPCHSTGRFPQKRIYDFLEVFVDDVLQPGTISGEVDWQQKNISIPAGSHIIKWIYSKDAYVGMGSDCGWVDKVSFGKASMIPVLQLLLLDN